MTPLLAQRKRTDRAFEKLYQRHVGDVYRYALVVMRNPADAEDVTQTTFLNAYRAFARGERPRTAQNWLISIAHNVCRQRFRQLQRRPNELPLDEETAEPVADEDAPTAEDIRRALGHLAFNQRAALVMRELEGRSYAEIAEVLGLTTSAVETLLFRARRALREQLEGGLTCREAELAISRQLDGRLSRKEKGALRAHLRECDDCARFARSQRAQRSAIRGLALIPLPASLTSFFHHHGAGATAGAGAVAGGGVAMKAAIVGTTAIVATGVGVEAAHKAGFHPLRKHHAAAPAPATPTRAPQRQAAKAAPTTAPAPGSAVPLAAPPTPSPSPPASTKPVEHGLSAKATAVARGRVKARGRLKAKPSHQQRAHPAKPAVPPGQAKKAAQPPKTHKAKGQSAVHARRSAVKPKRARPTHPAPQPKPKRTSKAKSTPQPPPPPKPPKPVPAPNAAAGQKK